MATTTRRGSLRALLLILAALLPLGLLAPASAATMYGHDVSWPQCPAPGGFGLPMPPSSSQFVVIGLTRGLAFTENPCLSSQVSWARTNGTPAHGYAMGTFPTGAQLSTYGSAGPWRPTTRAARLSNVGYAEAQFAIASMNRIGWRPPTVWIDVEPRPAQPWPGTTAAQQRDNRYVVEGLMRGLRDAGFSYGLYSYTNGWNEVTGGWRLPGVPVWATAGHLDYPTEADDRCVQPSFSGGPVRLSQWTDDVYDYNRTCGSYAFTPLPMPASSMTGSRNDLDGDWRNDLLAREASSGYLWLYRGDGAGSWLPRRQVGHGWNGMSTILTVGDLSGDGAPDVLAVERSTGYLWLYRGDGRGGWLPRARAGHGWGGMEAVTAVGDFTGDQRPDVVARVAATGELRLYPGTSSGTLGDAVRVGGGWQVMDALAGPGDFDGDGAADLMARDSRNGALWLYRGSGSGGWLPRVQVGWNWQGMDAIVGVGDFDGDRTPDVLARQASTGDLYLYPGNGSGGWRARAAVGHGWQGMSALT